jgi:peptidoglycan/LPS O-acetylase OafA/YrhL
MRPASDDWLSSWHVNPSLNKDYDFLDGLRGGAILMVVVSHLTYVNPQGGATAQFVGALFSAGAYGVTMFFTLSGFLIALPFWRRKVQDQSATPPGYAKRRFWKIYPPLALAVIVLTPLYVLQTHDASYWTTALQWLTGWAVLAPVSGDLNPVMWSLIVELHFYALLPILFWLLQKVPARPALWIVALFFLLVPNAVRLWHLAHGHVITLHPDILVWFPSALDCFAFGVTMAGLENLGITRRAWTKFGDWGVMLLFLFPFCVAWLSTHPIASPSVQHEVYNFLMKISAGLMLCYATDPGHPRARLLSQPWLRWCGIISYEWYLFHQPIAHWARDFAGAAGGNIFKYLAIVAGPLLTGLLIAALVYRYFSLPILKFGRGKPR